MNLVSPAPVESASCRLALPENLQARHLKFAAKDLGGALVIYA